MFDALIRFNDRQSAFGPWKAEYLRFNHEESEKYADPSELEKAAIASASSIVRNTQAVGNRSSASEYSRQKLAGLVEGFRSWVSQFAGRYSTNTRLHEQGLMSNAQYYDYILTDFVLEPYLQLGITSIIRQKTPDWWEFALTPVASWISWIPVIGSVAKNLMGTSRYNVTSGQRLNNMVDALKNTGESQIASEGPARVGFAAKEWAKMGSDKMDWGKAILDTWRATEYWLNFAGQPTPPVSNIAKTVMEVTHAAQEAGKQKVSTVPSGTPTLHSSPKPAATYTPAASNTRPSFTAPSHTSPAPASTLAGNPPHF